eukprot:c24548_g1_i1 orf=556-1434(-)
MERLRKLRGLLLSVTCNRDCGAVWRAGKQNRLRNDYARSRDALPKPFPLYMGRDNRPSATFASVVDRVLIKISETTDIGSKSATTKDVIARRSGIRVRYHGICAGAGSVAYGESCGTYYARQSGILQTLRMTGRRVSFSPDAVPVQACYCEQTRAFASGEATQASSSEDGGNKETISVTFVNKDGEEKIIKVPVGMSMLEAAHENDIELEGACEGSLACSTCHVIVMDDEYYRRLSEPTDEENDMLDLAFGLTEMSRLGCQVIAKPDLDGMRLALPAATRNFAVDGYVPKPH